MRTPSPLEYEYDELSMETTLASVGPTVPPRRPSEVREDAARRTMQAWIDEKAAAAAAAATAPGATPAPRRKRTWSQTFAIAIVVVQALWAIAVPLKNVATVFYPTTRPDSARTTVLPYTYARTHEQVVAGKDVVPLLESVLEITLGNYAVRKELEASGSFDIDRIYSLLSLEDFAVVSQYYALVLQSSEFPGGTFTPRAFMPAAPDAKLSLVLRRSGASAAISDDQLLTLDIACSQELAFLQAVRCTGADGYPCPGDYAQENETRTFTDVDLRTLVNVNASGLANNVGLLFVVDYFQQAMSALFASKDWTATLEALQFVQAPDEALGGSTMSAFYLNQPLLNEQDAFLVAVQAAAMETTQLDSCFASELIVGQFYTRTFVLDLIQRALVANAQYDAAATPIHVPTTTAAVLAPVFAFDLRITSGAQFSPIATTTTRFLSHIEVAHELAATSRVKLDHTFNAATQVAGSSMRMLQYLAFFPELTSVFASTTLVRDASEHDVQTYKLLGATRSGINTFKEPSTGANAWMVFPLAELSDSERPSDAWWDDERAYAAWFATLEATLATAPFRVFDAHLRVTSETRVSPVDDRSATRCHRALFKVLAKVAYVALTTASKPTSYLMFMSEVALDHRTWLLTRAFTEELAGENFFGGRVAFAYRNGPFTRKDDGSAWVLVPLLHAMLEHFGAATTLALVAEELEQSLAHFVKVTDGDLQFPDAAYCHVDGRDAALVVDASDSIDDVVAKLAPGLEASVADLLALIPAMFAQMQAAMAAQHVADVSLSRDQVLGTPVVTASTEGVGAPTDWRPTALTAGLLKLWPSKTPLDVTVQQLRDATQCYRMLELRYLNVTTRCFAEPKSVLLRRRVVASEGMRTFFLNNWTMAVMLNTLASVIVLKYLEKLLRAWRVTKFECLDVEAALQLNLQGMGVLNISQSLLLLAATLPSLLGFHIAESATFLPFYSDEQLAKPLADLCVTLSMSWFVKVGFEFCNNRIRARRPADWVHTFRVRLCVLALLFVLRLAAPERAHDGPYLTTKLVVTCVVALLLGACSTAVVFLPERRGKVASGDHKASHDAVLAALVKQNLPLSRYGVLGRTSKGWSKAGLIVAGWKVAQTDHGDHVLLRKGAGEILLPPEPRDDSTGASACAVNESSSEVEGTFDGTAVATTTTAPVARTSTTMITST